MRKTVVLFFVLGCLAYVVACGGKSSTSNVTNYDKLTIQTSPAPITPTLLGGAMQSASSLVLSSPVTVSPSFAVGSIAGFNNVSSAGSATFNRPLSVTTDGSNLYVADYFNNVIRKINIATQHVTTIAGNIAGLAGTTDGVGNSAFFNRPSGIVTDGKNLYVTDSGNFVIRKIDLTAGATYGNVTTFAGTAGSPGSIDNVVGSSARFNILSGITTDGFSLFVTDSDNTIRRVEIADASNHAVTTLAGTPGKSGSTDGNQTAALFNQPARITTDGPNLYVTDYGNSPIRKIVLATGIVSTIAGKVEPGGAAGTHLDAADNGLNARFNQPNGITCDGVNLYVTDSFDNTVRKIVLSPTTVASGPVSTLISIGTSALNSAVGITTDGSRLYVTDFTADSSRHTIQQLQ